MQTSVANVTGTVFNIQRFSVNDGPGIRTTVFLKGCPLRCRWCCNPESHQARPEISRNTVRCTGCGACIAACPHQALHREGGAVVLDRRLCRTCGTCVSACPSEAVSLVGQTMTAREVAEKAAEDALFYRGEGGMTLSGGEALAQADFALAACIESHREGISTALETSAFADEESLKAICRELDFIMMDIKHMNPVRHKEWTGVDNALIQRNIAMVSREFPRLPLILRCPVIPGFNDDDDNIIATARLAGGFPHARLELLPYHRLGEGKYPNLGRRYDMEHILPPSPETMKRLRRLAGEYAPVQDPAS